MKEGLKAARIAYVNQYLSGTWAECDITTSAAVMNGYLDQASAQVSGYYENMLVDALRRELSTAGSQKE